MFSQNRENIYKWFFYQLIQGNNPLELLSNRDYIYSITHDVFYSSVFNRDSHIFELLDLSSSQLVRVLEFALLMSIRQNDIDVLMELLCATIILKKFDNISDYIVELVVHFLKGYTSTLGYIGLEGEDFLTVYHTTLVGKILYHILSGYEYDC